MTKARKNNDTPGERTLHRSAAITVVCDIVLILALVLSLFAFISKNREDAFDLNVENITDIAVVESGLMHTALDKASDEIVSAYRYCRGRDVQEILDYLAAIEDPQADEYQLLKRDEELSGPMYHVYTGYSTRRDEAGYRAVTYKNSALASSIFGYSSGEDGQPSFSQSFTNATDALRYFAVFCGIEAREDGAVEEYYLVKPQNEKTILDQLQVFSQYEELDLAVCYSDGRYLASDGGFRAGNFYDYLYKYNDLTLDERNAIRDEVVNAASRSGSFFYKDYRGRDCVFAYSLCHDTDSWQVIVAVPTEEFINGPLLGFFPLTIIIFLAGLLVFNVWRLLSMLALLRQSMEREVAANASKSSFLSRMSHEIRTPLNAVIGYNTIALSALQTRDDAATVRDSLLKSDIASKHLLSIINDVLDMSAIESGKLKIAKERFDLKKLVDSLTAIFASQAEVRGVTLEVDVSRDTQRWLLGDQMRVNQILTNLLSNAVKFTPEGGRVAMLIEQRGEAEPVHIRFRVEDTGIGMAPDYLRHIWDPFEQADSSISRRFGGTGLGLSITKTLVDLMGGSIAVESVLGQGSVFTVDLSFDSAQPPEAGGEDEAETASSSRGYDFGGARVLLVEDNRMNMEITLRLLKNAGLAADSAWNGLEAVELFAASPPGAYAAILMDVHMPEMDGYEATRAIRASTHPSARTVPIIAMTADVFAEDVAEAKASGMDDHIGKPVDVALMFKTLDKYINKH